MLKSKALTLAISSALVTSAFADDTTNKSTEPTSTQTNAATSTNAVPAKIAPPARTAAPKQANSASTNATFGTVAAADEAYKSALDAHALADALKLVDKDGGFKGTVAKVYEPRGLAIVEFDEEYKTALTAIVRANNFDKFPALTNLIGKNVLITGKFTQYRDAAQIVLEKPEQIKVVEEKK